jgi:hypothetical protein
VSSRLPSNSFKTLKTTINNKKSKPFCKRIWGVLCACKKNRKFSGTKLNNKLTSMMTQTNEQPKRSDSSSSGPEETLPQKFKSDTHKLLVIEVSSLILYLGAMSQAQLQAQKDLSSPKADKNDDDSRRPFIGKLFHVGSNNPRPEFWKRAPIEEITEMLRWRASQERDRALISKQRG